MKTRFLFFALISVMFLGCSSDSGNSLPITEENLLGKWYFKGITINNGLIENYEHDCPSSRDYQEILSSHNLKYYHHGTDCQISDIGNCSWILDGKQLTVIDQDPIVVGPNIYTVVSITQKELILRFDKMVSASETQVHEYYYTRN